jgi:hypothetical protein
MIVSVEVLPIPGFPDRWGATVLLDGRATSRDCSHLHHSTKAADGCVARTLIEAERMFADGTVEEIEPGLFELSVAETTRRFRYLDEVES